MSESGARGMVLHLELSSWSSNSVVEEIQYVVQCCTCQVCVYCFVV